jgi:hypothetical protein
LLAALFAGGPAQAQFVNQPYIELMFEAADRDGSGTVCEAELVADTVTIFARLDADDDDRLSPAELDGMSAEIFASLDVNSNGMLSFSEVMTPRLELSNERDPNKDGCWTLDELLTSVNMICQRLANGETVREGPFVSLGDDIRCLPAEAIRLPAGESQ